MRALLLILLALPMFAANRYWVGGGSSTNWNATGPTNWAATSGGAGDQSVPGAADDVFFDASSTGTSVISANITINSLDCNGSGNTITHNAAVTLTHDQSGIFRLASAKYTIANASTSALIFTSTSGTTQITTAGNTLGNVTFDGAGGTWQLQDTLNAAGEGATITLTRGTLDTNGQTVNVDVLSSSNSNTRTLTLGASTINIGGSDSGECLVFTTTTGLTLNPGTSSIVITPTNTSTNLRPGGLTFNNFTLNISSGSSRFVSAGTYANLTINGAANKTGGIAFDVSQTVTGTLTINGNSSTNRILVTSITLGTAITLTAATANSTTITNADFRDITGAGAATWDLSTATGGSGDAGGNSMKALGTAAFTTPQTQYWVGDTGNWSTAAEWGTSSGGSGGRVPLPQDDVVFDNGSFSTTGRVVTVDMPRAGRSIDWSAYSEAQSPQITGASTYTIYGSLTLQSGMTYNSVGANLMFEGRGSFTFTTAGKDIIQSNVSVAMVGGTLTMQDALTMGTTSKAFILTNGTFNANGFNITAGTFTITGSSTRTLTMGSGTWTVTGTGTVWGAATTTGLTFTPGTSTIAITNTSATAKTFAGGGLTYNNVTFAGDNITVTGSNTFNTMAVNTAGYTTGLLLTASTTQTITSLTTNGSGVSLAKMMSTTTTNASLSKASGAVAVDYMNLKDITGTGGATWCAGANSTDGGDNTNWTFSACGGATRRRPIWVIQ